MAKGTETLKEARDIIEEMNLNIDRFNQGLKILMVLQKR